MTLYRSLRTHCRDFTLYVLCLDQDTHALLSGMNRSDLVPIDLRDIETWDPALQTAKSNRSLIEYYFTLSPILPLFVLETYGPIELITYVDADIFFYASPDPIFDELGKRSILTIEHRFPDHLKHREILGRFNVQFLSFRNDDQGMACLNRWRTQCLEWCYDRPEGDKFADQKYLDTWPVEYRRLVVLQHKGAGVGPWNWSTYPMRLNNGRLTVADAPLIFYHFHGLKILSRRFISLGMYRYDRMPVRLRKWLYGGYVRELRNTSLWLDACADRVVEAAYTDIRGRQSRIMALLAAFASRQLMRVSG